MLGIWCWTSGDDFSKLNGSASLEMWVLGLRSHNLHNYLCLWYSQSVGHFSQVLGNSETFREYFGYFICVNVSLLFRTQVADWSKSSINLSKTNTIKT